MSNKQPKKSTGKSVGRTTRNPKSGEKKSGNKHTPKSAETGRFVSQEYAKRHPNTTFSEDYISKPKTTIQKPPTDKK